MPTIRSITADIVEIPLRHRFITAQDTLARQVSRPVVVTLTLDDGNSFEGEAVPVAYITGETPESARDAIRAAAPLLEGSDLLRMHPLLERLKTVFPDAPTARAGLEGACYRAFAGLSGISLWRMFGGAMESVETDITLSIVHDAAERAREASARGFRRFKMKVGSADPEEDRKRIREVHQAVPDATLRLDANQAFTPETALVFIQHVLSDGIRLELVEQPVPKEDIAALNSVAASSPVPIFADESVKSPADALRLVRETCVQGINVKLMKAGIAGALDIVAITRAAGRKLMIGCMLETRRGIDVSLALACGTGAFDYVDLDSHLLLAEKGDNPYFVEDGPMLSVFTGS